MEHSLGLTHILGHKRRLNKFKRNYFGYLPDHKGMKLGKKKRKRKEKKKNDYRETKQHATKKLMVSEVIKKEIKNYLETNENENTTHTQSMGYSKSSF